MNASKRRKKGFTERQARFLTTVMLHAGVCVPRQYARFCGIVYGAKTRKFFDKLVRLRYASITAAGTTARASTVNQRALYAAMGEAESRLRKPVMLNHAIQRLMEPRFKALYRVWKEDGDIAFAACRSHVVDAAVTAGAGRVETLELGHRYGISPRWLLSHEAEQPAVFVAWQPSMSFHRGGSDPKK